MAFREIELLAPAKNYEYGVAAIDAGADAVYIGAPMFGARAAATNSLEDIERLTKYAHLFGAKVFVTLNIVLFDDELDAAKSIAQLLTAVGVDALIVQDMAYLQFGLDIPLHASTQSAALTPEKALFYQRAGFERVILERAMSLDDMAAIRAVTDVELEAFVHGAICVSYSGQCYMGQVVSQRSGNRGVCSQPCRSKYNLVNERGEVLIGDKHLLSLLDMNLSDYVPQMIENGINSFKIEGRLKDISYLKNSVAHYRMILDKAISGNSELRRASLGVSTIPFAPNPIKTFSRRYTPYFIEGENRASIASFDTAKAIGEQIGEITAVGRESFTVNTPFDFSGGDGVCFIDEEGNFGGTNINSALRRGESVVLYPNVMSGINVGAMVYRNSDKKFIDEVTVAKVVRKIDATIKVSFDKDRRATFSVTDIQGVSATFCPAAVLDAAMNVEKAESTLKIQLAKSGDTIYNIVAVEIEGAVCFLAVSQINSYRRELLATLNENRLRSYKRNATLAVSYPKPYAKELDYKANVTNKLSRAFYEKCGFEKIEEGVECGRKYDEVEVMTTRYCVRREIGECLREGGGHKRLFLENNGSRFELKFDCDRCGMRIINIGKI